LVLVQQLVLLHRSTIEVVSTVGQGTTFAISLLTGKGHLPATRIDAARRLASIATRGRAFVEKASRRLSAADDGTGHCRLVTRTRHAVGFIVRRCRQIPNTRRAYPAGRR
jgi:hypothetical protein